MHYASIWISKVFLCTGNNIDKLRNASVEFNFEFDNLSSHYTNGLFIEFYNALDNILSKTDGCHMIRHLMLLLPNKVIDIYKELKGGAPIIKNSDGEKEPMFSFVSFDVEEWADSQRTEYTSFKADVIGGVMSESIIRILSEYLSPSRLICFIATEVIGLPPSYQANFLKTWGLKSFIVMISRDLSIEPGILLAFCAEKNSLESHIANKDKKALAAEISQRQNYLAKQVLKEKADALNLTIYG